MYGFPAKLFSMVHRIQSSKKYYSILRLLQFTGKKRMNVCQLNSQVRLRGTIQMKCNAMQNIIQVVIL